MKKIFSTIVMLFSLSVFSQNNSEKLPVFENCKTKPEDDTCFFETIQDNFKQNFNKEYTAEKSTIIALFAVDTLGKFDLLYIDAASEDIKNETKRIFSLLPKVEPATYNGNFVYAKYTLKVNFPFSDDNRNAKVASNAYQTEKITAKTEIEEFDKIVYNKFENPQLKSGMNIPFNHQKYAEFDAYMNQVGANSHTAEKPYSYKDVSRYYDFEKNYNAKARKVTSWWGRKFWNENLVEVQGDGYWFLFNPILDMRAGKDFDSELKNTFVNTRGVNIQAGLGKNITFTTSIYES